MAATCRLLAEECSDKQIIDVVSFVANVIRIASVTMPKPDLRYQSETQ